MIFDRNLLYTPPSEQLRLRIWPTFPLNFFLKFLQMMPLNVFYIMVQKVKNGQKLKARGPTLKSRLFPVNWLAPHGRPRLHGSVNPNQKDFTLKFGIFSFLW